MGGYLKFLGILILSSGLFLGGLTLYYPHGYPNLEQKISKLDKEYETIVKDWKKFFLLKQEEERETQGLLLMSGGILLGSLFLGLGETVCLLKKISRRY